MQNGHVGSFNCRLRDECLNANWFRNLFDARVKIAAWRNEYNGERPHSSLGYRTPNEFAEILKSSVILPSALPARPGFAVHHPPTKGDFIDCVMVALGYADKT